MVVTSAPVGLRIIFAFLFSSISDNRTVPSRNPVKIASSSGKDFIKVEYCLPPSATQIGLRPFGPSLPSNGQQIAWFAPEVTR